MLKKLGLMALSTIVLGSPLLSIASADSVNGFTSDSEICSYDITQLYDGYSYFDYVPCDNINTELSVYACYVSDNVPSITTIYNDINFFDTSVVCPSNNLMVNPFGNNRISSVDSNNEESDPASGTIYFSNSPITYSSSSAGGSDSDGSIGIPSGFTDSVNGLVSNFAGSIGNYAPTLIIIGLGVVLLFTFWGVIRSWAVRIFNRKGR